MAPSQRLGNWSQWGFTASEVGITEVAYVTLQEKQSRFCCVQALSSLESRAKNQKRVWVFDNRVYFPEGAFTESYVCFVDFHVPTVKLDSFTGGDMGPAGSTEVIQWEKTPNCSTQSEASLKPAH